MLTAQVKMEELPPPAAGRRKSFPRDDAVEHRRQARSSRRRRWGASWASLHTKRTMAATFDKPLPRRSVCGKLCRVTQRR